MHAIWRNRSHLAAAGALGVFLAVCLAYGGFALASGLGLVGRDIARALPQAFVVHALAGGVALIAGGLQAASPLRRRFPLVHRIGGRTYVATVVLACTSGIANAIAFEASLAAKISLCLLCGIWLLVTVLGHQAMRKGHVHSHRAWMLRSFSLSLFFVTFSFWVPAFASSGLPHDIGYSLAVTLSWTLNLVIAEAIVQSVRTGGPGIRSGTG